MRVTLLASDLGATLGGTFAAALATHLPPRFEVTLLALAAGPSTATAHLARAGTSYRVLPVRHRFDLPGFLSLRRAVAASRADVLHVFGRPAARVGALLPRPPAGYVHTTSGVPGRTVSPTPKLLSRFDGPVHLSAPDGAVDFTMLGVPPGSRVILAAGGFDVAANLRAAVWAFDVLRYTAPDWRLVLCGDGPLRGEVERFARQLGADDFRVHFLGVRDDLPALMRSAYAVWVTHRDGGAATALEAMAVETPLLVNPRDPVALAAATFNLAPDPVRADAGRLAAARFSAAVVAERVAAVYDALPGAPSLPGA